MDHWRKGLAKELNEFSILEEAKETTSSMNRGDPETTSKWSVMTTKCQQKLNALTEEFFTLSHQILFNHQQEINGLQQELDYVKNFDLSMNNVELQGGPNLKKSVHELSAKKGKHTSMKSKFFREQQQKLFHEQI